MPELNVYTLRPRSAFHLGEHGIGLEETASHAHSDTLFSALLAVWVQLGNGPKDWSSPLKEAPPFLLTSIFPFAGKVRFYPLPLADLSPLGIKVDERRKDLRRISFVSEGIFRRIVDGQSLDGYLPPKEGTPDLGLLIQGGRLWLSKEEAADLPDDIRTYRGTRGKQPERPLRGLAHMSVWKADKVPRVTVNRRTHASNIFHSGRVSFAPGCGLWFGVAWLRPDERPGDGELTFRQTFELALSALADGGLGGERAAGYGAFCWQNGEVVQWTDPAPGQHYVTLSRYHPRSDETPGAFTGDSTAYSLQAVAGYLQAPGQAAQRRRRLWLVAEGSVLCAASAAPFGDLTDVRPQVGHFPHEIWRYGLACPVKLEVPHGK